MTTINDISDFARILQEQPEWVATLRSLLLTEELLNLPAQFAEFVQETRENNRVANERLTRLEVLVQGQGEQLRQLQVLVQGQQEQLRLLNELQTQMNARQNSFEGRLANYEGALYEGRVRHQALYRAEHYLGLEEPYLALVQDDQSAPQLNRAISLALNGRTISQEQSDDLHNADLIISGRNGRHAVFEISLTAAESDITRARRRADILASITGEPVSPAIIAVNLPQLEKDRAFHAGVDTFVIPFNRSS